MIRFQCTGCGATIKVNDNLAGKRGKCPKCGTVVTIPFPEPQPVDESAPPHVAESARPAVAPPRPAPAPRTPPQPRAVPDESAYANWTAPTPAVEPAAPQAFVASATKDKAKAGQGKAKLYAAVAAGVVIAGGVAAYFVVSGKGKPATAQETQKLADGLAPVSSSGGESDSSTLPTLPDGRFKPDGFVLSAKVTASYDLPEGSYLAGVSEDAKHILVQRTVQNVPIYQPIDAAVPPAPPYPPPAANIRMPDHLPGNEPILHAATGRFAYTRLTAPNQRSLIVDGKVAATGMQINGTVFSPDGSRLAYIDGNLEGSHVVIDGVKGPSFKRVGDMGELDAHYQTPRNVIHFSPDSRRVAYAIAEGEVSPYNPPKQNLMAVVVDGKVGAERYGIINHVVWSPDSRRLAVIVTETKYEERINSLERAQRVIVDGVAGPLFHRIDLASVRFSPDSRRIAYAAIRKLNEPRALTGGKAVAVLDGVEQKPYDIIFEGSMDFDADNKLRFLAANKGTAGPTYLRGGSSNDSVTIDTPLLVRDGVEAPSIVGQRISSPDRRRTAVVGRFPSLPGESMDTYRARVWKEQGDPEAQGLFVDGTFYNRCQREGSPYIRFSPDSRHVLYVATDSFGGGISFAVDGEEKEFPLKGRVAAVGYNAPDTIQLVTVTSSSQNASTVRRVEVRLKPAEKPRAAAAAGAATGSPEAEAQVAQFRKLAEAAGANEQARLTALSYLPMIYARAGDRAAALAADAALPPAAHNATDRRLPYFMFGGTRERKPTPVLREVSLLYFELMGRRGRKDAAGAAAIADEIEQRVLAMENARLPENSDLLQFVANAHRVAGQNDKANAVLPPASSASRVDQFTVRKLIAQKQLDEAETAARAYPDASAKLQMLLLVATAIEESGDKPRAAALYREMFTLPLIVTGGYDALLVSSLAGLTETAGFADAVAAITGAQSADRANTPTFAISMAEGQGMLHAAAALSIGAGNHAQAAEYLLWAGDAAAARKAIGDALKAGYQRPSGMIVGNIVPARDSARSDWYIRVGTLQIESGDDAGGIKTFDQLAGETAQDFLGIDVHLKLSERCTRLGRKPDALRYARKAEELRKASSSGENWRGFVARALADAGDLPGALAVLGEPPNAGSRTDAPLAVAWAVVGSMQRAGGNNADAERSFQAARLLAPTIIGQARAMVARALCDANNAPVALTLLSELPPKSLQPDDLARCVLAAARSGDVDTAATMLNLPVVEFRMNAVGPVVRTLVENGNYAAAADLVRRYVAGQYENPMLLLANSGAYERAVNAGDFDFVEQHIAAIAPDIALKLLYDLRKSNAEGAKRFANACIERLAAANADVQNAAYALEVGAILFDISADDEARVALDVAANQLATSLNSPAATRPSIYIYGNGDAYSFPVQKLARLTTRLDGLDGALHRLAQFPTKSDAVVQGAANALMQLGTPGAPRLESTKPATEVNQGNNSGRPSKPLPPKRPLTVRLRSSF
jgi:tetratricopeptide (TPR) repeat protein